MTSRFEHALLAAAGFAFASPAFAEGLTPPEYVAQAKDVLKTSIGYRTVEHGGQTKAYADYLASFLKKAGFPAKDIEVVPMGDTAAFVATLRGASREKPILLSAHMDVVEAKPEDWERDPFKA